MRPTPSLLLALVASAVALAPVRSPADDPDTLKKLLAQPVLTPRTTLVELQEYLEPRIPTLEPPATADEWRKETARLREEVLAKIVFRGEAANWKTAKTRVEELETVPGDGYRLKKLRYEVIPGLWVPALLYEPEKPAARAPVMLAVNGHDRAGKATGYKQIRCINLAKRGVIVLNTEWFGMGQLRSPGNEHGAMNQLDLCGTSGLSVFYLNMSRGLDLLLAHPNADPQRVAVSGLSGGGWQTIIISALDPRVTLANPVAGYSSFRTRVRHFKDLGDSEQTPTDLATVADYTHLTAMRAPRPTLLTYNAKDNCCFEAGYALPPLVRAAAPLFKLHGAENALRTHINEVPGDHNYGLENREALYKMVGDFFYPDDKTYSAKEIECDKEVKKAEALDVRLPDDNLTINVIAKKLAAELPRGAAWPQDRAKADDWQTTRRTALKTATRFPEYKTEPAPLAIKSATHGETTVTYQVLKTGPFSVPVVELTRGKPKSTVVVIGDGGRAATLAQVEEQLKAGNRVIAADVYYFGECHPPSHDWLWSLMLATIGERALGVQAAQLVGVVGWAKQAHGATDGVKVVAVGPRTSTVALVAAAVTGRDTVAGLELHDPLGSLKEVIDANRVVATTPELFCFGLLERFDVADVAALVAPRPVVVKKPSERAKAEFARLGGWYRVLGREFDPLK
jgi:hypothetical protein